MIGQTVSHYRIDRQLGAGGMGVVYEAVDTRLDRRVALKFLPPESTADPQAKARFIREAKAASALDHPNVCTIHEIGTTEDDQLFIVMGCYEGETLRERIARGPLPVDEAVDIARQVAEGLAKAHDREIVHRDIKPTNIFITTDGLVKILDFGLAKLSSQTLETRTLLTRADTIMGTVNYMSPEQASGETVDHRADIWCLAAVLYEMLTGRLPFAGEHQQAVIHAILNRDPDPVTGLRTGIPMELERIVCKALAKSPGDRYQHMVDLLVDLRTRADSAGTGSRARKQVAAPAFGKRRPGAILGGVFGVVLVLGAVLLGLNVGNLRGRLLGDDGQSPIQSLAVLPFDNMMGVAEQDFFVEGMHEALITELSKIGTLRVISRTTAMYYRETDKSIPEIARELNVDALVEGSVLRVGDRVRITAQLIRGGNDEHLWAEDYDRDLKDVLNLLSEVARSIAGQIHVVLTPQQRERLTVERTVDPDVYEMFLRGTHHLHKFTVEDALEARRYFQRAIAADPEFAPAHAGLAGSYVVFSIVGDVPSRGIFPPARDAARRALELDGDLGVAHTVLGFVEQYFNWDWAAAEREYERALELDPGEGEALHGLANVRTFQGRLDEAVELARHARQFDPYSYLRNVPVWIHLMFAHRYTETIAEIERWRSFAGDARVGWYFLFNAFYQLGRHQEAMVELRHSSTGRDPAASAAMEQAYAESGIKAAFLVCANRLVALSQREYVDPLDIVPYFALAGDADRTFAWLEKAYEERVTAIYMIAQPALDPYRPDPRFGDLLLRIGIPESGREKLGGGGVRPE